MLYNLPQRTYRDPDPSDPPPTSSDPATLDVEVVSIPVAQIDHFQLYALHVDRAHAELRPEEVHLLR